MLPKIELHVHLDGAIRYETLVDLAKKKSISLPSYDPEKLKERIVAKDPANLKQVLEGLGACVPAVCGDPEGLERIAYELCEIQANHGVIYFEVRFSPHFFSNTVPNITWPKNGPYKGRGQVGPEKVVQCVLKGLKRGEQDFRIKTRIILCCISGYPAWSKEVLNLCVKYLNEGVVGIDVASSALGSHEDFEPETKEAFQDAVRLGIHRTVHAGEAGSAEHVKKAIDQLQIERIGHGYHAVDDENIYQQVLRGDYHLEVCPLSSWLTGAADEDWAKHPARKFASDKANFSINTDDPTVFDNNIESELKLCREKLRFTDDVLYACQLNAAKSAFLPDQEKTELIKKIQDGWSGQEMNGSDSGYQS